MPASGVVDIPALFELTATRPDVYIGGSLFDYCWCEGIERNVGVIPSKAIIRLGGSGYDIQGNVTLNAFDFSDMEPWTRVQIASGIEPYFLGALKKRRDQGQANSIVWEAWDDRWILSTIPVRGCLVYDDNTAEVNFISGFVNRTNPNGYHNCRGAKIPGIDGVVPVFTYAAEAGSGYENSDTTDSILADGKVGAWTAYKYLKYLCALANIKGGSIPGAAKQTWRSLATCTRLSWLEKDCELLTTDASDGKDMYKKMPDHTFQAKTMLAAIGETLQIAPSFGMKLSAGKDSGGNLKSQLKFYSRDMTYAERLIDIPLLRGGPADDIRTIWDFDMEEDASQVSEACLVEGARRKVEFSIEMGWDGVAKKGTDESLAADWTDDEALALAFCINGGATRGASQWAKFPRRFPDVSKNQTWMSMGFDDADGTGGKPFARSNTADALNLARGFLPRPYAAFAVDSNYAAFHDPDKPLLGFNQKFADQSKYPVLDKPRPILPEQLQYYLDTSGRMMRAHFPVRIRLYDGTNKTDVLVNSGIRVEGDGTIYLDGLTDDIHVGATNSLYTGSLISDPSNVKIKQVAINAAVPLDHRVSGYAVQMRNQIDPTMSKETGGPLLHYIDSPEGFKEHHQVISEPCAATSMIGATAGGVVAVPINQILEDDSARITSHAQRAVKVKSLVRRISSLAILGIQNQYDVGLFIGQIVVKGQAGDQNYIINAPIERYLLDFKDQLSRIGGLLSECGKGQQSKRAFTMGARPVGKRGGAGADGGPGGIIGNFNMFGFAAQQKMFAKGFGGIQHTLQENFDATQKMMATGAKGISGAFDKAFEGQQKGLEQGDTGKAKFDTDNPMNAAAAAAAATAKKKPK